ncbi:ABC transporter permease [Roseococcus sp. SYP-B2431]|uniref:ABC transporter permease n=1 Tax=Roseococcus sp. SYP-B2431 TaxID=2496640 RepID=UPI0013F3C784|nr:ABC transporter permease [Roseococcus sp. SYP-B2431]
MQRFPSRLPAFFRSCLMHRELIARLVGREVSQRFRGSMLGLSWALLLPLLTAVVYTFVFSAIFQSRWGNSQSHADFALMLLIGMAVHSLFAEAVGRAPGLVVGNPSYVTKVIFPLEILPVVAVLAAVLNAAIMLAIVIGGQLVLKGVAHWTVVFLPVILLPYLVFVAAGVMLCAAIGVFMRDLSQVIGLMVTMTFFLTPIFYPLEAVPERFRIVMRLNPLTSIIEQSRTVIIHGGLPDFASLAIYSLCALLSLAIGFWAFQRLRPGFADVL